MKVYLVRNDDVSEEFLIKLMNLLKSLTSSFDFSHIVEPLELVHSDGSNLDENGDEIEPEDFYISTFDEDFIKVSEKVLHSYKQIEYFSWKDIFESLIQFRQTTQAGDNDLFFLFTDQGNHSNWTSTCDYWVKNFYVQTSYWEEFFEDEDLDSYYPIAFEVLSWIYRSLVYNNTDELKMHLHTSPRGCIMDFCRDKRQVALKMRTADLCKPCSDYAQLKRISIALTVDIFGGLEKIRPYIQFITRLAYLQKPRKLVIRDRLQHLTIPDILGEVSIPLKPKERAVYLFFLSLPEGILLSELADYSGKLSHYYGLISGLANRNSQKQVVQRLIETQLQAELSNIRKEFKALLGENLAKFYTVEGKRGQLYKINLSRDLIEFSNY